MSTNRTLPGILPWLILLSLFSTLESPAYPKNDFKPGKIELCVLDNFSQIIKKEGLTRLPRLPFEIEVSIGGKDEAARYFSVGAAGYRHFVTSNELSRIKKLADRAKNGAELSADESDELSEYRAVLKVLRYLFVALDKDHKRPKILDRLVINLGKFRDEVDREEPELAARRGASLVEQLDGKAVDKIDKEIRGFKPTDKRAFNKWLVRTVKRDREILGRTEGPLSDLHLVRKDLQTVLSIFQIRLSLNQENAEFRAINDYLAIQTERIGAELVKAESKAQLKETNEGRPHAKDPNVEYPQSLDASLILFLDKLKMPT